MDANRQHRLSQLRQGLPVQLDIGHESHCASTNDRKRERKAVLRRPNNRFGTAADANPGAQPAALDWWIHDLVRESAARAPRPGDWLLIEETHEQIEFLLE